MKMDSKKTLGILMLLAGAVLVAQCVLLLFYVGPIAIKGNGSISGEILLGLLAQVFALCTILVIFSFISRESKLIVLLNRIRWLTHLPLAVGFLLAIEGLVLINIANLVVNAAISLTVSMVGVQLFCLGILSISSYVVEQGNTCLMKGVPNYVLLLFIMFLLPAAFFITD
jgi:hypothetical protein